MFGLGLVIPQLVKSGLLGPPVNAARRLYHPHQSEGLLGFLFFGALFFGVVAMCPAAVAASFSNAAPLITARGSHTATLLSNGKLLVAGGQTIGGTTSATAELYDPSMGTWTAKGSMVVDRARHTATMLPNGQILVAGGYSSANGALSSAEVYDPIAGTWTATGSMAVARDFHTATLLSEGQVLVVGGTTDGTTATADVEIYDPVTRGWTATNSLNFARFSHTATLLPNGQVLIAGGTSGSGTLVTAAELYDPSSGTWTATNSLVTPRYAHTATLIPSGQVLVAGGTTDGSSSISGAELYDPSNGTWTTTNSLNTARFNHTATLLPNGSVLVTGGTSDGSDSLNNAEIFSSNTGTWTGAASLNSAHSSHTATLLASGEVLIAGGFNTNQALASVERYNPATGVWTATGSLLVTQSSVTDVLLANGKVLVVDSGGRSAELYDPSSGVWTATAGMSSFRVNFSTTLLPNGKVLIAGGSTGGDRLSTAVLYDPATGTWTQTGSMHQPRAFHTATLLASGDVLVAGGSQIFGSMTAGAELYHPATGTWDLTGSLNTARDNHLGVLLANGKVLVAGGFGTTVFYVTSAELYDPASGAWTYTGGLNVSRTGGSFNGHATATLLLNGKVLAAGGSAGIGTLASAELYDPATGVWTLTASLPAPRSDHTATLLPGGKVLIAGGHNGTSNFPSAFLYDAPSGTWTTTASLSDGRDDHGATLLPNGTVLVMGGNGTNSFALSSAELYDPGLGFRPSWQPQVGSVLLLNSNAAVNVSGAGFRGISEGSSGNGQDSPADYPVLQLMNLESGQALFLLATNWSRNSASFAPVSNLPAGYSLATVFVNGIPSPGQITKIPTLPRIGNLPASAIGTISATLNGQILDTGGNTPSVTLYYGTSDGGTNEAAWSNSIVLGLQSGAYAQTLTGLLTNTTYYFTAKAVNVVGTFWATPSQSFTTITLPIIANLPATGVQDTFATLNGQVLFTGNQPPSVTIYYGPTDGGTNATAWSNSVAIGPQSGGFAQTVNYLETNTTYYFTAQAANVAGAVWAIPSQTFTTAATNSLSAPAAAVLTQHNDNARTGMNLNEVLLNTNNVNPNSFGLLFTRPVDDQIYAQPLVATNVNILGRGTHNIVIVATVNDTVYAFDADQPTRTSPYWTTSFISPPEIVPPNNADESAIGACGGGYFDFTGSFGIVGTPVIDPISGTIYVVARTKEFGTNFVQRLHALDITTGLDHTNSPVIITATFPGRGAGNSGGMVSFDPVRNNQRPALTLVNGVVYIAWSSHCDLGPYHGWVIGYNASTLQQVAVFNDTPNGSAGGIWMSGQGPSADPSGNVYVTVGNGSVDATDYGESFLKLAPPVSGTTMSVASYFIPLNWPTLNGGDLDLGTAGLLLIPGTTLAISGGKAGTIYVVNRDSMGGISAGLQTWTPNSGEIHGGPVWWSGPNASFLYVWPDSGNHLFQYRFSGGLFNTTPLAQSTAACGGGSPGGILSISANGTNAGSGILWAAVNTMADANHASVAGTLHAYNAQNVGTELWNSDTLPRNSLGSLAKFVPPTIANGRVYMATFSGRLNVYGALLTAANLNAATLENQPMTIPIAKLLALGSNPYGFPVTVTSISSSSTNGGTVVLGGNALTYTPVSGYLGVDRFSYTISDGQGGLASGYAFVQVLATNQISANMLPPATSPGGIVVSFAGIPSLTYSLQRALTVTGPWTIIATVTVGNGGLGTYVDASQPTGTMFYRTTYP